MISIDINGSEGNAFALLGIAKDLGNQLDFNKDKTAKIQKDMASGDYDHLCSVFKQHFGMVAEFI